MRIEVLAAVALFLTVTLVPVIKPLGRQEFPTSGDVSRAVMWLVGVTVSLIGIAVYEHFFG